MKTDNEKQKRQGKLMMKGITAGILISSLVSIMVTAITGSAEIWTWSIPVGVSVGTAIGAGLANQEAK